MTIDGRVRAMIDDVVVGIGHLTMLDVAPPELVTVAYAAGFDAVGIRMAAAAPAEDAWPMCPGSVMLKETRHRLADTGTRVIDVDLIRLAPDTDPGGFTPLFESAADLGAAFVNVLADDPDLGRVADTFAAVAAAAKPYGLRPVLEAMNHSEVRSLADAVAVVGDSGGGVTVDPLHLRRLGGTPGELRAIDPALLLFYQLCDAPMAVPSRLPRPRRMLRGQPPDVDDLVFEARAGRLLPGEGELPLADIVAAMPPDIPVSVEAPNQQRCETVGVLEYARQARRSVHRLLERARSARR